MSRDGILAAAIAVAGALLFCAPFAGAQDERPPEWRKVKCERYSQAWGAAISRFGRQGLGAEFLARHEAFLASGCEGAHDVCPRSAEELRLANIMVVRAMNAGTASTFPPFGCGR